MYRDLEDKISKTNSSGIIMIGEPGWGKTAFLSNSICSPTSSDMIFNNILAYHFCIYNEPLKHHPGHFTRNLVSMLINRLPEYGRILVNDSLAMMKLVDSCTQDPLECFELALVKPLLKIQNIPRKRRFVIIDAIDECHVKGVSQFSLIQLLSKKVAYLPDWIKFIVSSRNFTGLKRFKRKFEIMYINSHDDRNVEDIEDYLYLEAYKRGLNGSLMNYASSFLNRNNIRRDLISQVLEESHGNFLFAKTVLSIALQKSLDGLASFPYDSLCEIYEAHIERLIGERGGIRSKHTQRILEILIASSEALSVQVIHEIMVMNKFSIEYDDVVIMLDELINYLRYDEDGNVRLYHQSFADCLGRGEMDVLVRKEKGDTLLAVYYCDKTLTTLNASATDFQTMFLPCLRHVIFANSSIQDSMLKMLGSFPHHLLNASDQHTNQTILHKAVAEKDGNRIISVLVRIGCFQTLDVKDGVGKTPAFLAAALGMRQALLRLIKLGSNINVCTFPPSATEYLSASDVVSVAKEKFWESSSLHAASWTGQSEVVSILLNNGGIISKRNWVNATAIELACEKGYLDIVKQLYEAGSELTQKCLHHASREGHSQVVLFLLEDGLKDKCMPCKENFEWMAQNYTRIKYIKWELEVSKEDVRLSKTFGRRYGDRHLLLCQTALFVAVTMNHQSIVKILLAKSKEELNCSDFSGKFPIHEAVRRNNTEMVEILLQAGADPRMVCTVPQTFKDSLSILREEEIKDYFDNLCPSGNSVLHVAASVNAYLLAARLFKPNLIESSAKNDNGMTALHTAACRDNVQFVIFLINYLNVSHEEKNKLGASPLHTALKCDAYNVGQALLYHYKTNVTAVDNNENNVFHYVASCRSHKVYQPFGYFQLETFNYEDDLLRSKNYDPHVDCLLLLAQFVLSRNLSHLANSRNKFGETPLHIASKNGFEDAVNILLQLGANSSMEDNKSKLPIQYAIEESLGTPFFIETSELGEMRRYAYRHELVVLLLSDSSKVDTCGCSDKNESFLHIAVKRKAFYVARILLLKGFNLSCSCGSSKSTLDIILDLATTQKCVPDAIPSEFVPNFEIKCRVPFEESHAHLIAFFPACYGGKKSILLDAFVNSLKESHIKGNLINTCRDKEGYLFLHRAIQGGNVPAFLAITELKADINKKGPNGIDPLYLPFYYHFKMIRSSSPATSYGETSEFISQSKWETIAFGIIKRRYFKSDKKICRERENELSVAHMAAAYGMPSLIQKLLTDSALSWRLTTNCSNIHKVTPLYLAHVFREFNPAIYNITISLLEKYGASLIYPNIEAEYTIAFSIIFGDLGHNFNLSLNETTEKEILMEELDFSTPVASLSLDKLNKSKCVYNQSENIPLPTLPKFKCEIEDLDCALEYLLLQRKYLRLRRHSLSGTMTRLVSNLSCAHNELRSHFTNTVAHLAAVDFWRTFGLINSSSDSQTQSHKLITYRQLLLTFYWTFKSSSPCSFFIERLQWCNKRSVPDENWPVKHLLMRGSRLGKSYRYLYGIAAVELDFFFNSKKRNR